MCGIAGFIDFGLNSSETIAQKMGAKIQHRGPDSCGSFFENNNSYQIGFAHQRLSIIDLSKDGHQPMSLPGGNPLTIVFNGEIYNYKEVRKTLEATGVEFKTNSDTEVILCAWRKWGKECIAHFNGMFAFAVFDSLNQKVTLVRDRAGVKPLYVYQKNDVIIFGSELKSLMVHPKFEKVIDIDATALFMQYGYYPEPYTVFKNCTKLKAAHTLEIDLKNQQTTISEYWSLKHNFHSNENSNKSENEILEELEYLMTSAFDYRMVSDVPVGVFLSGGYDSTAVTALLQNSTKQAINTFTIGFEEDAYNEAPHAKKVAQYLGTNHTESYCTFKDAMAIIPKLPKIYDEPFADSSAIPTTLVSEIAVKEVKVALSSDGGDELFSGYGKYLTTKKYVEQLSKFSGSKPIENLLNIMDPLLPKSKMGFNFDRRYSRVKELISAGVSPLKSMQLSSQNLMSKELNKLFVAEIEIPFCNFEKVLDDYSSGDPFNAMLIGDYKTYMVDDILTKVDRAAMSVGLEGREPLLDYRLAEYLASVPYALKTKDGIPKYLLKEILHKYVPKEIMDRPKMGFAIPVIKWMKNELRELLESELSEERVKSAGIFNYNEVERLKNNYLAGKNQDFNPVWFLFIFHQWHQQWMK